MKTLKPEEFVELWLENHRVRRGAAAPHEVVQILKDFLSDWDSPVRRLVEKIYEEPDVPAETWRRTFKAGAYSIRDTEEFQAVARLTKRS